MIQYIIAAGIGAFLGSQSKKSKKSYAKGAKGKMDTIKDTKEHFGFDNVDWSELSKAEQKEFRELSYKQLQGGSTYAHGGEIGKYRWYEIDYFDENDMPSGQSLTFKNDEDANRHAENFMIRKDLRDFKVTRTDEIADEDYTDSYPIMSWKKMAKGGKTHIMPDGSTMLDSDHYAKGGKTKVKYDYIPKEAIDELSYTMDKVSKRVSGSNVLSGAYVKSASKVKAKTKSASKVKAKTKGSSDLTAKILAMMTDGEGNKKVILSTDVKEMQKYVSDKLITAFYLGLPKAYDFKGDYSYSGGLVNYEEDYAKKIVVDALKNIKANKFEMGLKYPQYNFEKLLGKPIIKDIEGKSIKFSSSTRTYTYRLWIWKDCVIGQTIGMTDSKDGYSDYTYGEEPTLMGGYKSVQTSKASKLESIAKFMAKDKDGYLKDNDVLYNGLGGANFDALDKNKIKYAKGGEIKIYQKPDKGFVSVKSLSQGDGSAYDRAKEVIESQIEWDEFDKVTIDGKEVTLKEFESMKDKFHSN